MKEKFNPHTTDGDVSGELRPELILMDPDTKEQLGNLSMAEAYLSQISEQELRSLMTEELQKSGVNPSVTNFVPFEKIRVRRETSDTSNIGGTFSTRQIEGGAGIFITVREKMMTDFFSALWIITHEELHAVSTTIGSDAGGVTEQIGLYVAKGNETSGSLDDTEAMTEILTARIVHSYCKRQGIYSKDELERRLTNQLFEKSGYNQDISRMMIYAALVTAISGVSHSATKNAFIRTYMRNGNLLPPELEEEIRKRIDINILYRLFDTNTSGKTVSSYEQLASEVIKLGILQNEEEQAFIEAIRWPL